MRQARKWLAALLAAVLLLGALPMAALAAEDPWDGAAEVQNLTAFKAALENQAVTSIKITGSVVVTTSDGTPEKPLKADKPILVTETGKLLLDPGAAMTSDVPMGQFSYEEDKNNSTWDRIAFGMAAFLMDGHNHRLLLGSLPKDVGAAIDGMTLAVLKGDVTVASDAEVRMLYVMNGGTLTISKGCKLTVTGLIHAEAINDFGELWADETVDWDLDTNYNCPRVMVCWEGENRGRNISMTPYDEYEIEKFVLYDYRNGKWGYFDVALGDLTFESPLSYRKMEGHERPVLTAKGAQWGKSCTVSCEGYVSLRVFIELPELGCYSTPSASKSGILINILKCSPVSSSEFYMCVNPDAWFVKEGYTVSDLTVKAVRYGEGGKQELPGGLIESQKAGNGVWKITAKGSDFNVDAEVTVTNPENKKESFTTGTGIFLEPVQSLVYSAAPLDGTDNGWGVPWKDAYKSVLSGSLSLAPGAGRDVYLYLLVYQGQAEGNKPAGWYCEPVNINQIRAEGVTVAQGKEDDDRVIRITAGSAGSHKVIRMQEGEQGQDNWVPIPGSTRGEPLTVTVASSGGSGGSGSSGGSGGGSSSGGSSSSKPAAKSSYDVSAPSGVTGGTVSVQPQNAKQGDTVTVTVRPEEGYALKALSVATAAGRKIDVTDAGDGQYTFTMPGAKVNVKASFTLVQAAQAGRFSDVAPGAYYYDAVQWAVEKGITGGTSADLFSPGKPCSRAQTVTFLWRAAGSPAPSGKENPFKDVAPGAYYYDAVLWAVEQGITGGTSAEAFSPEAVVTRGQTAAFLYRAAGSPEASGGGSAFTDVPSGVYYAQAVQWAVERGVTGGTGGGLFSPGADCTRAQIVTFLYRGREG